MINMEHLLSTVGVFSTEGYHLLLFEYLHGTEHPPQYRMIPPHVSYFPTVLNIPQSTQNIPHGSHDIPHGNEHPSVLKIFPTVLNTLHGTEHIYGVRMPSSNRRHEYFMCLILFSFVRIHSESRAYLCISKFQGLLSPGATQENLTEIYARADRNLNRAAHLI